MLELCVIFGGQSPEHEISRKSVTSVLNNLNKDKYNISTIGITKNGAWYLYTGDYAKIERGNGSRIRKTRRRQFFLLMQRIRLYLFLTAIRLRKFILTLFSLYFTVSSERTEQFKVFLNFREYLMSVWV